MEKLAVERGPTFILLTRAEAADAVARAPLDSARSATTEAVANLRRHVAVLTDAEDTPAIARVATIIRAIDAVDAARLAAHRAVDAGLAQRLADRDPGMTQTYATGQFTSRQRFEPLLNALQARVAAGAADAATAVQIARYAGDVRELAGLQVSLVTPAISERRAFKPPELAVADRLQGEIDRLRAQIDAAIEYVGNLPALADAWHAAQAGYFMRGRAVIDPMLMSGAKNGTYPLKLTEFITIVTVELRSLIALRDVANAAAIEAATRSRNAAVYSVAESGLELIVVVAVVVGLAAWFRRKVVGPLVGLTLKMEQLAFGKRDIEIELTDRADEVGGLARATLVFRDALVETDRLRIEQALAQQAAEAAKLEVQAANLQLEDSVAERTKQLLATQDKLIKKERLADEARKIAEEASRAKTDFLAMMSHELRTPLNAVIGYSELLLDETEGTEFQHHRSDLNHINSAGKHLLNLVSDILDLSKLEIGKVELETSDFDLVALIVESGALLEPKARDKGIELSVKIDPAARRRFRGDPTRLRQILLNLVDNAIKFTERGAVSIEVASRAATPGEPPWLRFEVSDTGIGVAEDVRQKLFQKFGQADSSITRRFGGTGLGLVISKQLLDLMGGRIGVERAPDHGSLFWFEVSLPPATSLSREQDCGIPSALKNAPSAA